MVILEDRSDETHVVMVSNRGWLVTLETLRPFGIFEAERFEQLREWPTGMQITLDEARTIGHSLLAGPLSSVNWSDNVYPPDSYWSSGCERVEDFPNETYWPSWLRALAAFCLKCNGFVPY